MDPVSNPRRNHRTRSSEDPCVHHSGLTVPVALRCNPSSPTAAAGAAPHRGAGATGLKEIPLSRRMRPDPGKAIGLKLETHRRAARSFRGASRMHSVADAEDLLKVVSDLVRDHVSLRELAAGA